MRDVVFVLAMSGFFGICVLYVSWCNRIVGNDDGLAQSAGGSTAIDSGGTASSGAVTAEVTP